MYKVSRSAGLLVLCAVSALAGVVATETLQEAATAQLQQQIGTPEPEQAQQQPQAEPRAVEDIITSFRQVHKQVAPSVVSITSTATVARPAQEMPFDRDFFRRFFREFDGEDFQFPQEAPEEEYERIGLGSGVIVDVDGNTGYIVTNNHVVAGADDLDVVLNDGRRIEDAKVIGTDPNTELAVVTIQADNLSAVPWGNSEAVQPGDFVLAFGSPLGYVGSMTHGIVSAMNRQVGIFGPFGYENFIQVDAPINPGNSGGPLVNLRGQIIGINTAIATRTGASAGIGFAVPSNQAQRIYRILRQEGRVVRGYIGLQIADVAAVLEQARALGYKGETGVLVAGVLRDSPAAEQLEPGDVIVSINGQKVQTADELRRIIAGTAPGQQVKLQIFRNGKPQEVAVQVAEQPSRQPLMARADAPQPEADTAQTLGLQVANLTPEIARRFNLQLQEGVAVMGVEPRSLAAEAGIDRGDVITRVDDTPVRSVEELRQALAKADLKQGVRMFLSNRQGRQIVFLQRGEQ